MDDLDMKLNRILNDKMIQNYLVNLYGKIAGVSDGYLDVCVKKCGMTRDEAICQLLHIDQEARASAAKAHEISEMLYRQEGDE